MDIKNILNKVDGAKALKVVAAVLGVGGVLISNIIEENNQKALKSQLKDELMKELTSTDGK